MVGDVAYIIDGPVPTLKHIGGHCPGAGGFLRSLYRRVDCETCLRDA